MLVSTYIFACWFQWVDCLVLESFICCLVYSLFSNCAIDRIHAKDEAEHLTEALLGIELQVFVPNDISWNIISNLTEDVLMAFGNVFCCNSNEFVPPLRKVFIQLFIDFEWVTLRLPQDSEGGHDFQRISYDADHLLSLEHWLIGEDVERKMRLGDKYHLIVVCDLLAKHSHHLLWESNTWAHVAACQDTSDLLCVLSQECWSAPRKGLHSNHVSQQIVLLIKELGSVSRIPKEGFIKCEVFTQQ